MAMRPLHRQQSQLARSEARHQEAWRSVHPAKEMKNVVESDHDEMRCTLNGLAILVYQTSTLPVAHKSRTQELRTFPGQVGLGHRRPWSCFSSMLSRASS